MDKAKLMNNLERAVDHHFIEVGMDALEKSRMALARLFVPEMDSKGVPAFKGLRDAYETFSGDKEVRGAFYPPMISPDLRACMDFGSSSFIFALQNAVNMYLSKEYRDFPYHEDVLISEKRSAKNYKQIPAIQMGYFPDIEEVDLETSDYPTSPQLVDSESLYSMTTKGILIYVTRNVILNDYIDLVKGIVRRAAKAARRTHARFVWKFFINNATCPDGTAWFTSGHGNLGNGLISVSNVATAIRALADMTEQGSGEKLGMDLPSFNWNLVTGIPNWQEAVKVNQLHSYYTANDVSTKVANPCYHLFGEKNERIIICPFSTDANDWGVIRGTEDVPIVEMSYLLGKEEPQFVVSEGIADESVFTGRRIGYSLDHTYGGTLADYRGGYKSIC